MKPPCAHCGKEVNQRNGNINRAQKLGVKIYCDKLCAVEGRRKHKTIEQLKEEKRLYDSEYRKKNRELLKVKKAAYFKETYDPEKAAIDRKKRAKQHAEYCRQPEYREWKRNYDNKYRAKKNYGEFWESFLFCEEIDREVSGRMDKLEIRYINNTNNKKQSRRREHERTISK